MERVSLSNMKLQLILAFGSAFFLFLFAAHSSYAISSNPTNVKFRCTASGRSTLTWSADPAASSYSLRLHKQGTTWDACASKDPDGPGNSCTDLPKSTTSYTFNTDPYGTYDVWIHSRGSDGSFSSGVRVNGLRCVPNCNLGSIPSDMKPGTTYSIPASFSSTNGELGGEIFRNNFSRIAYDSFGGAGNQTKSGSITGKWTPSSSDNGVNTIYCRAWNDAIAECRPQNLVDYRYAGSTQFNCTASPVSKTVCVDGQAPDIPTKSSLSCVYSTTQNGTKRYKVGHYWGRVADIGCTGLSSSPYWSQMSTSSSFSDTISGASNTWSSTATNISSSTFADGTVIYARVRSRDGLNNQSGWSTTTSLALNSENCSPDPATPVVQMCPAVQHCTTGSTTRFEYCGDCQGAGCAPGYRCPQSGMTCETYPKTVFFFDNLYNVPCSYLPQTPTPTLSIDVADKSVAGNLITNNKRADGQCDYGQWCKWTRNQTSASDIQSNGDLKLSSKATSQEYGSCWIQWVQNGKADGTFYRLRASLSSNFPSGSSFFQFETSNTVNMLNPPINTSGKTSIDWAGYLNDSNLPLSLKFCTWGTGTVNAQAVLQSVSLIKTVPSNTPTPTKTNTPTPTKTMTPTPTIQTTGQLKLTMGTTKPSGWGWQTAAKGVSETTPPTKGWVDRGITEVITLDTKVTSEYWVRLKPVAGYTTSLKLNAKEILSVKIIPSQTVTLAGTYVPHTPTPKPPTPTPTTSYVCKTDADCAYCGANCITKGTQLTCSRIAVVGSACICVTGRCTSVTHTTTPKPPTPTNTKAPTPTHTATPKPPTPTNTVAASTPTPTVNQPTATATVAPPTNTSAPQPTVDECPNFILGNATCDAEGIINNEDYTCWRNHYLTKLGGGTPSAIGNCKRVANFDSSEDGVTLLDFAIWRVNALRQSSQ